MRVVNDREDPIEVKSVDIFALISQMFLVSVGVATWVFSPMVMIYSHSRFSNPWSKIASLGGAVLALLFLEVPVSQVVIGFVVGLFVADSVERQVKPFQMLSQSLALALAVALGCVVWGSLTQNKGISEFWMSWVSSLMEKLQVGNPIGQAMNWTALKDLILFEGPFLYLSATLMSIWVALGSAAHFEWFKSSENIYCSGRLKSLQLPRWLNIAFVVSFVSTLVGKPNEQYVLGGIFRVLSGFMFIQGSVCLAVLLQQRNVRKGIRTLIYIVATVLGFYALVGMGIMSPWILRRNRISPQILKENLEEQI
jgi:hypothetical protein